MRDVDTNFFNALANAPIDGLVPRRLLYIESKSLADDTPTALVVWTGDGEATFSVESTADDESAISREYTGGVDLITTSIPYVSDLTIQTVTVTLNMLHEKVRDFFKGSIVRLGKVEIHDVLLDPKTRNAVAIAPLVFYGEVDGAPIEIGGPGSELTVNVKVVSDAISMLSKTNPARSSFQQQFQYDGDNFGKHSSVVATWQIPWGQEKSS